MVHENMSDQEIIAYVYKFGVDDDIMKLANKRQKGMIMHMEKKFESIIQSADYFTEAQEAALFECRMKAQASLNYEEGKQEGISIGKQEGIEEGKLSERFKNIQKIMENGQFSLDQALELLGITKEEYQSLLDM